MKPRVLYLEEQVGVKSENLLPLLAREAEIYLVTGESPRIPKADYARLELVPTPRFQLHRSWAISRRASEVLRQEPVDVVYSRFAIDWLLRTQVPVVAHNGGSWYAGWRIATRRWPLWKKPRSLAGFLHYVVPESISLRRAAHVITVSETLRLDLIQLHGLSPDRVTVAPNAVSPSLSGFAQPKRVDDGPHLVYVGRLHWMKGIVEFVESFVASPQLNVPFTIIGDGPDRPIIEAKASQDSRVRLLGRLPREAVHQELGRTNILVFPSLYEGQSFAVMEAMATGHACVTRDIPALAETLGKGVGLLCSSVPEMMRAVERLAQDAGFRYDLQMRAARRAADSSWQETARRILQVWRQAGRGRMK